ncbi:YbaB/EbfC family nucleoid-associated protein [Amycolatopsis sp. NPDC003676]
MESARMAAGIRAAQQRMGEIRAVAESDDGLVGATVGGSGELLELWLDPRVFRRPDSAALAGDITATVRRAAALAADEGFEILEKYLEPGASPENADLRFGPLLRELEGGSR